MSGDANANADGVVLVEGVADVDDLDAFLDAVTAIREETGAIVQTFDARYVVSPEHLTRSADLAARAFDRGENVARDRAVEILLYAAGRRQIDDALEIGVSTGETAVVALVDARSTTDPTAAADAAASELRALLEPTETIADYDPELVREFFDVSRRELDATTGDLSDIVLERVALLDVEK